MRSRLLLLALVLVFGACSDDEPAATIITTTSTPDASTTTTLVTTTTTAEPTGTSAGETTTTAPTTTTTTTAPPPPLDEFELDAELVAEGLSQPVLVTARPGDDRLYAIEQGGVVLSLDRSSGEVGTVLDITSLVRWQGEQGLLGLTFHPGDPTRMFVHYSDTGGDTTIEEYAYDPESGTADPGSARLIFATAQPAGNHNGGMIDFGPDGFLYIALGDGGGGGDTYGNGQDPSTVLGAILRIDVDGGDPYGIPSDNPFAAGEDGAPEVWAYGLRNPWRFSFDGTDLWVGDVGQGEWEEIDLFDTGTPGVNAGWPITEGTHCYQTAGCDPTEFLVPITEYDHGGGRCSVTGGVVYRGSAVTDLVGTYLYGDYCSGQVWGLRVGDDVEVREFTDGDLRRFEGLTSFGVGPDGEVYVMQASGQIWRIAPAG